MSTQSEAVLEEQLIKQLVENGYESIVINDEKDLNANFKRQLEKLNKISLTDDEFTRIYNHLDGGSKFDKAKN